MTNVNKPERATQDRVIALLQNGLGYRYLGNWSERPNNAPIEESLLTAFWQQQGHSPEQMARALNLLRSEAANPNRSLYGNNQAVYGLMRYGAPVKTGAGELTQTVNFVNWDHPEANHFAVAEEVTLRGGLERRPDVVLYLNGLAVGVLELKNSRVSIGHGIRQNLSNQLPEFNQGFFATVQLVMAGNDSEGLQYGTIGTPEKYFLTWKEDEADNAGYKLDKYLQKICRKERLLELIRDFVLFDAGTKKLPRVHQYFGLKAAQTHALRRQGGIIWHSQGAGKSILMVLLARWILENLPKARVLIVTDRDELDEQIERVLGDAGETVYRTGSGKDLMAQLALPSPRLMCSLVHKFGGASRGKSETDFERFIKELQAAPSATFGEVFVFVDECHRTQNGRLNRVMKALMPTAVFMGFTGTPLLKEDKATSEEVFGGYIHTYLFPEAVEDKVVLDLVYEARDIDQRLGSTDQIDQWFAAKTKGLNDWQRDELKKQWGTLQKVLSSRSRMDRVVTDIVFDFATKPRLSSGRGNAMLVAASIYEACKYFELLQKTPFKGRCAVITSYSPLASHITLEETGAHTESDKQFIFNTYTELLKNMAADPHKSKTETYEKQAKERFIQEPANMQLLVVVDKLLTGFDAPPCTYIYLDKSMQDHGLFQAICRTNRLDGDDKDFGYIVDYKDLFKRVEKAIAVYTSELDTTANGGDAQVLLKDRLELAREQLDAAFEALHLLCQPVPPPGNDLDHIHYFCGNTEIATDLQEREPQRVALYKAVVALVRAWANSADELDAAGYSPSDVDSMKGQLKHYLSLRDLVRQAAGETLDLKPYEADMRHLIDTYIEASAPRKISPFDGIGLLELIVKSGIAQAIAEKLAGANNNPEAVAESIENNVRSKIVKAQLADPAFFERMSALLDEIIRLRKHKAIEYEEYLQRIALLTRQVMSGKTDGTPKQLNTAGKLALYNNMKDWVSTHAAGQPYAPYANKDAALELVMTLDASIREHRPDGWRGMLQKEQIVKQAIYNVVKDLDAVNRIYPIVFAHKEY